MPTLPLYHSFSLHVTPAPAAETLFKFLQTRQHLPAPSSLLTCLAILPRAFCSHLAYLSPAHYLPQFLALVQVPGSLLSPPYYSFSCKFLPRIGEDLCLSKPPSTLGPSSAQ